MLLKHPCHKRQTGVKGRVPILPGVAAVANTQLARNVGFAHGLVEFQITVEQ